MQNTFKIAACAARLLTAIGALAEQENITVTTT